MKEAVSYNAQWGQCTESKHSLKWIEILDWCFCAATYQMPYGADISSSALFLLQTFKDLPFLPIFHTLAHGRPGQIRIIHCTFTSSLTLSVDSSHLASSLNMPCSKWVSANSLGDIYRLGSHLSHPPQRRAAGNTEHREAKCPKVAFQSSPACRSHRSRRARSWRWPRTAVSCALPGCSPFPAPAAPGGSAAPAAPALPPCGRSAAAPATYRGAPSTCPRVGAGAPTIQQLRG